MTSQLVTDTQQHITELLERGLTSDHLYHNLEHTLMAKAGVLDLGEKYQLSDTELEILAVSALFHDTGFIKTYDGHEDESIKLAKAFLKEKDYPIENIEKVEQCIQATKMGVEPRTLLQKIMKDADFNPIGKLTYQQKGDNLRHEWEVFKNIKLTDEEWLEQNYDFWSGHKFYTGEAINVFGKTKDKHLKKLSKAVGKLKKTNSGKTETPVEPSILGTKSSQMMFKTTLRNHIDLTSIADNKANMMLSISALIITITMPLLAGNIKENKFLLFPIALLMVTCILVIIFATLATRPVKTPGVTDLSKISEKKTNLFFYGNFYKMNLEDYKKGIREVAADDDILDNSVVIDLFFLGKALGKKFDLLHRSYSIFMIGMTLTVLAFAAAVFFSHSH